MTIVIICSLLALGIGFLSGNFYKNKTGQKLKAELKALQIEHKKNTKSDKKDRKDAEKFKKQTEVWKSKFEELNSKFEGEITGFQSSAAIAEDELKSLTEANMKLIASKKTLEGAKERAENKFESLNKKYQTDLDDLKEWRADKSKFDSHLRDYKSKLKLSGEQVVKLRAMNEKQAAAVINANEFAGKIRMLNAQLKKYKDDLKYWEKKHYEVNHELANYKKTYAEIYYQRDDLQKELESAQEANKAMEDKVAEYKTRFVKINQEYHQLIEKTGAFGKV